MSLGQLLLIRLHLEARNGFPNLAWRCSRVEVCRLRDRPETPQVQVFPCDKWLRAQDGDVELRSGKRKMTLTEACLTSGVLLGLAPGPKAKLANGTVYDSEPS